MELQLPLELLRSTYLIREEALEIYRPIVDAYFAATLEAKQINLSLFSSIEAPAVPSNVALVVLAGALTKADICEKPGTRSITNQILQAAADKKIDAILVYAESCPGGQMDGTKVLGDAINTAKMQKPVIGAFSGMTCSAGYWAQSQCTELYATSPTDMVGCIGVVATVKNPKAVSENEDIIEVYSDLSPDKNSEFRDTKLLKARFLNPVARLFHEDVKAGRGERIKLDKADVLSGATYIAGEAKEYGMIDGIMPINKIIARSLFLARTKNKNR